MAVKEKQVDSTDDIEWNVETEIQLFFAMNGHKPVGVNKYFHMVCIWEKFRAAVNKDISLKAIWDHLESMYDLVALDDTEDLPFPSSEVDFALPESEFMELIKIKQKEEVDNKIKEQKDKMKESKKDRENKEAKETPKKEVVAKDQKTLKEIDKKKEDLKKISKELELKKDKQRETKDTKKDNKTPKGRGKGKEDIEETVAVIPAKKERKDSSDANRETPKRVPKRPTRQSIDNANKASSSPRDTPPPKRRRI
ncbi:hypothetical protein PV327_011056 [Microctonus hyperodae]|nr:hypothetical protein PV327_011056 [Microctonus hyperodae]